MARHGMPGWGSRGVGRLLQCSAAVAVAMLFLATGLFAQGKGRTKVLEGNKLFEQKKYDEANNAYLDAQIDNPTSPIIDYNIANTLYEKKKSEEALKLLDKVLKNADRRELQAKAYYNMGNTLYRMNKLPESILAYQEALKLNPNDDDAKYNLEYVRAKLKQDSQKQQQKPQQKNQQQQKQQQQQSGENNDQDQQEQQQQQQDQNQQDQKQEQQEQKQEQQEQKQEQQAEAKPVNEKEISKEEAERILQAIQNEEKDLQKSRKMKSKGRRRRTGKDW